MRDRYCKIYVNALVAEKDLVSVINKLIGGKIDSYNIYTDKLWIIVNGNDAYDAKKVFKEDDNFLYSKFFLDVEPADDKVLDEDFKKAVALLLGKLWSKKIEAVASAEFEEELPRFGGYNYEARKK